MGDITDIDDHRPHHVNEVVQCTNCDREWVSAAPAGVDVFECPSCGEMCGEPRELGEPH